MNLEKMPNLTKFSCFSPIASQGIPLVLSLVVMGTEEGDGCKVLSAEPDT